MMKALNITSLRPGADGRNPNAPNAANYDESKANPYPILPDALVLKNGERVAMTKFASSPIMRAPARQFPHAYAMISANRALGPSTVFPSRGRA